jgi:phage-related minor tail protein
VYDSPSLSSFSGGVYDSPQLFAFAKGAGVFGEAGPEAIMPLTRGADGSLGVRAIGSGDSSSPEAALTGSSLGGGVTQHISVQGSADEATLARIQQAARQGAQDGYALVLRDLKQNGPARQLINRR